MENVALVYLALPDCDKEQEVAEIYRLVESARGKVVFYTEQKRNAIDNLTVLGSGKLDELANSLKTLDEPVQTVIFSCPLNSTQRATLQKKLGDNAEIADRLDLILDIFALRATTGEGKKQVELAQLSYNLATRPDNVKMSRQGAGIGTRGPGESKLESDRRHMKRRIAALEEELAALDRSRKTIRAARDRSGLPKVAIVGYTNAGKSTLLNRLTDAGILAEDKLFATLDPTTRKLELPDGTDVLLTDTVGFIRKLPHHLVHAFRSTLDEAVSADVLAVVVDASDPEYRDQLETTESLLEELGASGKPTLYVFNKCDRGAAESFRAIGSYAENRRTVCISAATGQGIELMLGELQKLIHEGKQTVTFVIPNADAGVLSRLYAAAVVEAVEYGEESITVTATVDAKTHGMYRRYDPAWVERDE